MLNGELKQGGVVQCDKVTALPRVDREGLTEKVTFRLRPEGQAATNHVKIRERASPAGGTAKAKAQR